MSSDAYRLGAIASELAEDKTVIEKIEAECSERDDHIRALETKLEDEVNTTGTLQTENASKNDTLKVRASLRPQALSAVMPQLGLPCSALCLHSPCAGSTGEVHRHRHQG